MRRREFITLVGGSAAAWPLAARAQPRERHIGVLMGYAESDPEVQANIAAFREGLEKHGWVEDRNIRFDNRWATTDDAEARAVREGTRRPTARPYSVAHHTHHGRAAATNAHHPHHFRERFRSGWQRLRRELSAA